ncbi:MAG: hypothetical protein HUU01_09150 [Saprospiraceae bacterium]|nr:hypothetical protein [Saprospiraceae bacterium]
MIALISYVLTGVAIGGFLVLVFQKIKNRIVSQKIRRILNFGEDDIVFVYQCKDFNENNKVITPDASKEDFIAMNNFLSALIKINWRRDVIVIDSEKFFNNMKMYENKNIILFGSRKVNIVTEIYEKFLENNNIEFYRTERIDKDRWRIIDGEGGIFPSETYSQIELYLKNGIPENQIGQMGLCDTGYITKFSNPLKSENKVMIIAGIRGIGTWGVAECIKKKYKEIYKILQDAKTEKKDFSIRIRILYHNYDISNIIPTGKVFFIDKKQLKLIPYNDILNK